MDTISGTTRLFALLGSPVSHSLSPLMHNEAFRLLGIDACYLCFDVEEQALPRAVEGLKACHIGGFNLTMPDKTAIIPLLDDLSAEARLIGAVNTVVNRDGVLTGYNTDGIGFFSSAREAGFEAGGSVITILGAGGAASAVAAQAALYGARTIHVFIRKTTSRQQALLRFRDDIEKTVPGCQVKIGYLEDAFALKSAVSESSLLVNATPVGMGEAQEDTLVTDLSLFHPGLTVADLIYNPRMTRMLRDARSLGLNVFNGMTMLLYQGAEAFRLWTGQEMPVEEIKQKFFR